MIIFRKLKVYDRGGWSYYVNGDYARRGAQTGTISIVFAENNEVCTASIWAWIRIRSI